MNRLDNDLYKAVHKKTEPAENYKDEILNIITNNMEESEMNKKSRGARPIGIIAASLIAMLLIAGIFTPPGKAAISRIIDLFEREKEISTEVEGEIETTDQQIQIGVTPSAKPEETAMSNIMTYIIYIDESRYYMTSENGKDIIRPIDYPEDYPEVYMEITQVYDKDKSNLAKEISDEIKKEYDTVYESYLVAEPIEAIVIDAHDGDMQGDKETMPQWNSEVVKYYLVDNTLGGTFVIKMKYFIEAEEGHGARFVSMLNEFTVIPLQ